MEVSAYSLSKELGSADFHDARLSKRLTKLCDQISAAPGQSLPKLTGSVASLEAAYRFLGNEKVTPEKILLPHIEATRERALHAKRIVIAHDKSELLFGGDSRKSAIGSTMQDNQGFVGLFSLALSRTEFVRPLGVVGIEAIFNFDGGKKKRKNDSERKIAPGRDALNWWKCVQMTDHLFVDKTAIHVMDREGDIYELLSNLVQNSVRFVIRVNHNRVSHDSKGALTKLQELLAGRQIICTREVNLSVRKKSSLPGNNRANPPRAARKAKLNVSATTVEIKRSQSAHVSCLPSLRINCVHVYEVETDEEPVDWKLYTTEPITNEEDVLNVVDDYRARWTIEEYFKALKTGCGYEKRQLEGQHSLLNALAVFAPMAWQLLLLRTLNNHVPNVSADQVLTKIQIEVRRAIAKKKMKMKLSKSPTINEAFLAIAALGGHIPNNGRPGWIVLGRGMETLMTMEIAWEAAWDMASQRCDQS